MERFIDLRRVRLLEICTLKSSFYVYWLCLYGEVTVEYGLITLYRAVFISFGGLLLYLEGPYKKLAPLRIDYVYLLLKK